MFDISNKTETIQFRVTSAEKKAIKDMASFQQLSISDFIKKCIRTALAGMFTRDELLLIQDLPECEIATRKEKKELDYYNKDRDDLFSILKKTDEALKKY